MCSPNNEINIWWIAGTAGRGGARWSWTKPTIVHDALLGQESVRNYLTEFKTDDSMIVMCSNIENELYKQREN